jgi:endonuclease YncB( thermonuclease family)
MLKIRLLAPLLLILSAFRAAPGEDETSPLRFSFDRGGAVLDGDTLLVGGNPVRLPGIDAPEPGPWARCWAEGALAGHARAEVQRQLSEGDWRVADLSAPDAGGRRSARLVRSQDGEDLGDFLVVHGYAARTAGHWDWCGGNGFHQGRRDEPGPPGPNLWWPSGPAFDARAND